MSDPLYVAADRLLALADELAHATSPHPSRLDRAVALDFIATLAGDLRDEDVRTVKPHSSWPLIGRAFGVTPQAACKRWG
jgi:hypothetical protein